MRAALAALPFLLAAGAVLAGPLEFRSVGEVAVLYDAPSQQAVPLFVIRAGTPVEAVVQSAGWVKVRDASGGLAWIEGKFLTDRRTVIVRAPRAEVRRQPDAGAPLVFEAEKDVVLELQETGPVGWVKVRHRDGASGFVRISQVWGA